ncbi:MAG: hypothetical protein GWN58_25720 [Anaerolineae bacterium]|nr:hypothetical protein [Anaerolineae bacterium]
MNEADVRRKVYRLLRELGYWPITQTDATVCPKCGTRSIPPIGRPDILVLHPTQRSVVVEVKSLRRTETSFPFKRVTPEQRQWLDRWEEAGGLGYLAVGVLRPHKTKTYLDHLYLVDWTAWKEAEGLVSPIQGSIPLEAGKGTRRVLQEKHLDILNLLRHWALHSEDGRWQLPKGHSAWPEEAP